MERKEKLLMDIAELSKFLGVPTWTVRGMLRRHELPYTRFNRRIYFEREKIISWIKSTLLNQVATKGNYNGITT